MNLVAGSLGGIFPPTGAFGLQIVSVVINNLCNLNCSHCYLRSENTNSLSHDEWNLFFLSLFKTVQPSVVTIAGKEPFINDQSAAVLFNALELRDKYQEHSEYTTRLGVITNGTRLHRYRDQITASNLDYMDISIDGLPNTHDSIRGNGAFSRLSNNLKWLVDAHPDRIWITHTITEKNYEEFPEFVNYCVSELEVPRLSVGIIRSLSHTKQSLDLTAASLKHFFSDIFPQISEIPLSKPVDIILDIDPEVSDLITILQENNLLNRPGTMGSEVIAYPNGVTLRIHYSTVPVGFWRAVRVSEEGHWLAAEDLLYQAEYHSRAATKLEEVDFDAWRAYQLGLDVLQHRLLPKNPNVLSYAPTINTLYPTVKYA